MNLLNMVKVQELLDTIWFALQARIPPYKYGEIWMIKDADSSKVFNNIGKEEMKAFFGWSVPQDLRTLREVGIGPGARLEVIPIN